MEVIYRELVGYRYQLINDCNLPIVNKKLRDALADMNVVSHQYYKISSKEIWAKGLYSWDGATGAINTKDLVVPSLIHDIGCQAINNEYLDRSFRPLFDKEYYEQCLLYGVCKERAKIHHAIISLWGKIPKDKEDDRYAKKHQIVIAGF